jgi:hypothetical protein
VTELSHQAQPDTAEPAVSTASEDRSLISPTPMETRRVIRRATGRVATRRIRVGAADLAAMAWIHRHGSARTDQVIRAKLGFERDHPRAVRQRLTALAEAGLLIRDPITHPLTRGAWRVTGRALREYGSVVAGTVSRPAQAAYAQLFHRLAAADLELLLLADAPGARWETERELAAAVSGLAARLRMPDGMLVDAAGRRIAVELEIATKSKSMLTKIVNGYAAELRTPPQRRRFDGVWWVAASDSVARRIAGLVPADQVAAVEVWRWDVPTAAADAADRARLRPWPRQAPP